MLFLYNLGIHFYSFVIRIAALFNPKAQLWVKGRKNWKDQLEQKLKPIPAEKKIWVHCASLGEFEQGRPLIEALKKDYPSYKIILTFFSPSGYELRKNYEFADVVSYLPADTKQNADAFIDRCKPEAVIFVKYEFWLNYLFALQSRKIPTYLISAVIKKHQPFFKWYGSLFVKGLRSYKAIMLQDEQSARLLESLSIKTGTICGDTRVDRVLAIKENSLPLIEVKSFVSSEKVIIAGSTWPKDEALLIPVFKKLKVDFPGLKLIIAPHETDSNNIQKLASELKKTELSYALYTSQKLDAKDILVIDTVGILSSLYKFGHLSYVGGGFDDGIHNILEPAVYGMPVIFGPNHKKFVEADNLLRRKGAFEVKDESSLYTGFRRYLNSAEETEKAAEACRDYVLSNSGASRKILEHLQLQ